MHSGYACADKSIKEIMNDIKNQVVNQPWDKIWELIKRNHSQESYDFWNEIHDQLWPMVNESFNSIFVRVKIALEIQFLTK